MGYTLHESRPLFKPICPGRLPRKRPNIQFLTLVIRLLTLGTARRDLIVVLAGGQTPYVIQETGQLSFHKPQKTMMHYRFVGECYVHGIMDGEAMNEHFSQEGAKAEIFLLG